MTPIEVAPHCDRCGALPGHQRMERAAEPGTKYVLVVDQEAGSVKAWTHGVDGRVRVEFVFASDDPINLEGFSLEVPREVANTLRGLLDRVEEVAPIEDAAL